MLKVIGYWKKILLESFVSFSCMADKSQVSSSRHCVRVIQKWSPEWPNIRILKSKILSSYDKHDVFVFHTVS